MSTNQNNIFPTLFDYVSQPMSSTLFTSYYSRLSRSHSVLRLPSIDTIVINSPLPANLATEIKFPPPFQIIGNGSI